MSMCDPVPLVIPEGQEPFVLYVVSILIKEERYDSTWGWGWSGGPSDYALWTTSFVGPFTLEHARPLAELEAAPELSLHIDEAALLAFGRRRITDDEAEGISQGRWLEPIGRKDVYVVIDESDRPIALVREKGRRASSVMVVRPATLR